MNIIIKKLQKENKIIYYLEKIKELKIKIHFKMIQVYKVYNYSHNKENYIILFKSLLNLQEK